MGSLPLLFGDAAPAPSTWARGALLALALAIIVTTVALLAHVWHARQRQRRRTIGAPPPVPPSLATLARRPRVASASGTAGAPLGAEAQAEVAPRLKIALRRRRATPTGVIAKHCPRCGSRYDLAVTHCEKDGIELRTLN
ncbi:MAG TPA: hypothetical protein VKE22_03505 [Haliangiales bacterium]|nr:hypothetical protein [Haliangiales bacterium]